MKKCVHRGIDYAIDTREARDGINATVSMPRASALAALKNIPRTDGVKLSTNKTRARSDIVFVTSRFRSGSTVLWNAFRQLDAVTAYYEPFNERRFFSKESRGNVVDSTHVGVSDYWKEYENLEILNNIYCENWTRRELLMDESSWNPKMLEFIDTLIDSAKGRPVMQFNRIDFRLPWVKKYYPNSSIVHLWRNPREQWCSTLINIENFPFDSHSASFPDHFYLKQWTEDLKYAIPLFRDSDNFHPYQLFYLVWKISWLFGQKYACVSISYESLVYDNAAVLMFLSEKLGIHERNVPAMSSVFEKPRLNRWPKYASNEWFDAQEFECEILLDEFFNQ